MATIGNIVIGMHVNTVNFQKALFKASDQLKRFGKTGAADVAAGAAKIQSALSRLVMATQLKEMKAGFGNVAAGVGQLAKGLGKLSISSLGSGLALAGKNAKLLAGGLSGLGSVAALGGVALGGATAVKTAVSLEDAMIGLSKATDLEGQGLEALKAQLFGLSTELKGVKLEDVLSIATSGAKQGVGADQLAEYTRGIAMLSTAMDDIPAEAIADSIGKINVVFGLGVGGAKQLGSAIDKLADSGVSSSSGIMDVTQRISGTAAAMHLSAPAATAMAAALLDTGTQAEMGASAINRLLMAMVDVDNHKDLAKAAGVSVEQFAKMLKTKPEEAIQAFLRGLKKLEAADQLKALESIGMDGAQGKAEIQKLAQQTETFAKYLGLAANEFKTLEQLNNSYNKTAEATSSVFTQFGNNLKIALGHIGNGLLILIKPFVAHLNNLLAGFNAVVGYFSGSSGAKIPVPPAVDVRAQTKAKATAQAARNQVDTTATEATGASVEKMSKRVATLEAELKSQVGTFGKSSTELDLYKLKLEGATDAQLKSSRSLATQLGALEKQKQLLERGGEVMKENLNPFEQYIAQLKELDSLLKAQAITLETYQRAKKQAFEQTAGGAMEKELRSQIATVHMSAEETRLYELKLGGASKEQLATASSLLSLQRGMERSKAIFEETRTPLETYFKKLQELEELANAGLITPDTFARGKKQAGGDLGLGERQFAGAAEFGSAEAYSAILSYQGVDSGDSIRDVAKRSKEQVDLLSKILAQLTSKAGPGHQLEGLGVEVIPF